eukprot:TRINITY_DN49843_c0_g1_i1.p1 TRINITY_DN49843_c0_g1~~TRINITY_DN49843_c0_g1_i1.p1  ORF type:complete len:312 (-),score=45.40 TRINITY_DN49843_c0_g1_i1:66-941(-)
MVEPVAMEPRASCDWMAVLSFRPMMSFREWWQLREISESTATTVLEAIRWVLRDWPLDPSHPHGGIGGLSLTSEVHLMIRRGATTALAITCAELRQRRLAEIPWLLRSKELAMYAAGHANSTASLETLLALAPQAANVVDSHRGFTLLHEAVFCRKTANVAALLSVRCSARAQSLIGETALHIACRSWSCAKNLQIVEQLLSHDAGLCGIPDESGLLPSERLKQTEKRWYDKNKRETTAEEQCVNARIMELLSLKSSTSSELGPRCEKCGIRAGKRRTRYGVIFCAVCGVS